VTEVSEDEDDDLSFLPVKSIDDFKKFERNLKQNEDIFRKLVCFILSISWTNVIIYISFQTGIHDYQIGKKTGRPDKRVNNELGKRGIKESLITKAIQSKPYS
jgi:hypothetical protein